MLFVGFLLRFAVSVSGDLPLREAVFSLWAGSGVSFRPASIPVTPSGGGRRGVVDSFSFASCRRLRRLLLTRCGSGRCWSVTLTLRGNDRTPSEWTRKADLFGRRLRRLGMCAIWRVELQKRGMPHFHLLLWDSGGDVERVRSAWLDVWGLLQDRDHQRHAVHIDFVGSEGWLAYMAAHASKHKADQLGWPGRQWGVWGREFLGVRPVERCSLPQDVADYASRLVSTLLFFRFGSRRILSGSHGWMRFGLDSSTIDNCIRRALVRFGYDPLSM